MRVSAPWLRKVVLDDKDDGNYVIPNLTSVVVGGTHQDGDWDRVRHGFACILIIWFDNIRHLELKTRISSYLEALLLSQAFVEQLI